MYGRGPAAGVGDKGVPGRGTVIVAPAVATTVSVTTRGRAGELALAMDVTVWGLAGGGFFWPVALALVAHAWRVQRAPDARERALADRVRVLSRTRSGALDVQAAELKRIERDLHDGAQARIVSLAMNLGLTGELLRSDPDTVADLFAAARATTLAALEELRTLMEGIQLMAQGRSNAGIASALVVTENAVSKHINSIFGTLELPAAADDKRRVLAALAYLQGPS